MSSYRISSYIWIAIDSIHWPKISPNVDPNSAHSLSKISDNTDTKIMLRCTFSNCMYAGQRASSSRYLEISTCVCNIYGIIEYRTFFLLMQVNEKDYFLPVSFLYTHLQAY